MPKYDPLISLHKNYAMGAHIPGNSRFGINEHAVEPPSGVTVLNEGTREEIDEARKHTSRQGGPIYTIKMIPHAPHDDAPATSVAPKSVPMPRKRDPWKGAR